MCVSTGIQDCNRYLKTVRKQVKAKYLSLHFVSASFALSLPLWQLLCSYLGIQEGPDRRQRPPARQK
jgi:hypothetical protein